MEQKDRRIDEIKELYDQLVMGEELSNATEEQKIELYSKNQELSEQILSIIEEVLRENSLDKDALLWKIRIYNGPHYDDASIMITTAQEIIDKLSADKKTVFNAFDWLSWIYENKLELKEKAIEVLHDKLIEISLLKDEYSLQDREFGETYYMIGYLYRELEDYSTAISFYKLAYDHFPDHYYATYQGGRLCLEKGEYKDAYELLNSFYIFHGNEYSVNYAKEIEALRLEGKLQGDWDLLSLLYNIGIDYPEEFGAKNSREYGLRFTGIIEEELNIHPDNLVALRMKIRYYIAVEKNTKRAFETLERYYSLTKEITSSLYYTYFELAEKFNVSIPYYPNECDGFYGYNLMTRFLEKAVELKGDDDERALKYYDKAKEIGQEVIKQVELYFEQGKGSKVNNNAYGYAMLCNNLGIAIRNVSKLRDDTYDNDSCRYALSLHKKGYEYSPFVANLDGGLFLAETLDQFEDIAYFSKELLTYYDEFSSEWMSVQGRMLKGLIHANRKEESEFFYKELKERFELKVTEDEDVVTEMIYIAADFFTYVRYSLEDYPKTIALTEEFFQGFPYIDLVGDVAKINYWFSLAWSYHGLNNREEASKYFDLLSQNYEGTQQYQSVVDEIPQEYRLPLNEREAVNRLWNLSQIEVSKNKEQKYYLLEQERNLIYLQHIVEYIIEKGDKAVEYWINDACHLKVNPRSARKDSKQLVYDTSLDFYFKEENYTIRFNIDEREETVKKIFGLFSKKVWTKEMYVCYYFYNGGEDTSSDYAVYRDGSHPEIDIVAEELWSVWANRINKVNQDEV